MTRYRVFGALVAFMILTVSMSGFAQVQEKNLVGWWLFDSEKEETGNWGDVVLNGATLDKGQLVVETGKWAHAYEYTGPTIEELTLATWVSLDDYSKTNGSALCLDKLTIDQFCAIVWAERVDRQWMPGSSHFRRTNDFPQVVTEKDTGDEVNIVITYKNDNNQYEITGYRNGESMGSFKATTGLRTWPAGDAEAIWGKRHTSSGLNGPGELNAHINESRIYDIALTADDVSTMYKGDLAVEARDKLATRWARIKR